MLLARRFRQLGRLTKQSVHTRQIISSIATRNLCISAYFSSQKEPVKHSFKAETKKLLDIVAKSLYTDSEVFLRELLSNASDALEKQRFTSQSNEDLMVNIQLYPNKSQVVIQDNGIGMSKEDLIDNLGTIAKSGSKQFIKKIEEEGSSQNNIIGQFGVGFYSSFIIADHVDVISRNENGVAHKWSSDGSGQFEVSQVEDDSFNRGTKIILHVKKQHQIFLQKTQVQKIAQKYSNFINFPIALDGQSLNLVKPLWTRDKKQISQEDYQKFYEYLSNSSEKYQYKMHYASDVPLQLKSIMFAPITHSERMGFSQEKGEVSLYSKKVLIKKNCKDVLLPNFLRFMKGVVDCEDIPLNISRQSYQDSALMAKLRSFLTKRILKSFKDQANKNPEEYIKWYADFQMFIKQGSIEPQFRKDVLELNRYHISTDDGMFSLKQYIQKKKPTQDRIFFMFAANKQNGMESPYVYSLKKAGIPVLLVSTPIDQGIFREIDVYEGLKFANCQTDTDDIQRNLKSVGYQDEEQTGDRISEQQLTPFSLWIKQQLQPYVDKVIVSKKSIKGPALLISPISSSTRQAYMIKKMMEERSKMGLDKMTLQNLTFEYNPSNPVIFKLNTIRKNDPKLAGLIAKQVFDNCCIQAGLESDAKMMITRINEIMSSLMDAKEEAK